MPRPQSNQRRCTDLGLAPDCSCERSYVLGQGDLAQPLSGVHEAVVERQQDSPCSFKSELGIPLPALPRSQVAQDRPDLCWAGARVGRGSGLKSGRFLNAINRGGRRTRPPRTSPTLFPTIPIRSILFNGHAAIPCMDVLSSSELFASVPLHPPPSRGARWGLGV